MKTPPAEPHPAQAHPANFGATAQASDQYDCLFFVMFSPSALAIEALPGSWTVIAYWLVIVFVFVLCTFLLGLHSPQKTLTPLFDSLTPSDVSRCKDTQQNKAELCMLLTPSVTSAAIAYHFSN